MFSLIQIQMVTYKNIYTHVYTHMSIFRELEEMMLQ